MPKLDIPISIDLQKAFDLPPCSEIKLPSPKPLKITLPSGGSLKAINDLSKAVPTDCSMVFSLMLQIAPLLASMECLLKILKLLKPLIDIITGLTKVPPAPPVKAVQDFAKAAADLVPCFLIPTPANLLPFVKDLICLILKALKCFLAQLKSLMNIMGGITIDLDAALRAGNTELAQTLQCSLENAQNQGKQLTSAIEPIGVILDLAGSVFGLVGIEPIKLPTFGDQADLESLNTVVQSVQGVVATLQVVADALGGCD
jgi:hypothetical protein